jgi:hypothetical protein
MLHFRSEIAMFTLTVTIRRGQHPAGRAVVISAEAALVHPGTADSLVAGIGK